MTGTRVTRGPLVLADISGYTSYLGGVELEHSHDVLADLLGIVSGELGGALRVAKLEGDAVFCVGGADRPDGEELLAAVEACYLAFARRRRTIATRTSCRCDACTRIPDLDLKFLAHCGDYVEHDIAGSREVVGPDVIVAHRLLKNSVGEQKGLRAYALLTEACARDLGIDCSAMTRHVERYEDVGEIEAFVWDLEERWRAEQEHAHVRLEPGEAMIEVEREYATTAGRLWEALTSPEHVRRWKPGVTDISIVNPAGAPGVGSTTHCVHGEQAFDQEIVDWKPVRYFTYREEGPYGPFLWTLELTVLEAGGTRLATRVQPTGGRRQRLMMVVGARRLRALVEQGQANLVREVADG